MQDSLNTLTLKATRPPLSISVVNSHYTLVLDICIIHVGAVMSHISPFVVKLSLLCRTISIQINTGGKTVCVCVGGGGVIYRVGICPRGERTEGNHVGAKGGGALERRVASRTL